MDIQTIFPYNLVSQKSFMANFIKHTICLKHTLFIGKISITLGRVKVKIFKYNQRLPGAYNRSPGSKLSDQDGCTAVLSLT
jgi:hypothetical protein